MDVDIRCPGAYAIAYARMRAGEVLHAERDAMVAMSHGIEVKGGVGQGGVAGALKRRYLGGETFFTGTYRALVEDAWVAVSPAMPGDIVSYVLDESNPLAVETGAYVASAGTVEVDPKWAGVRNVAMREGAMVLHASGSGPLLLASYGGIQRFTLQDSETMIVDTGHVVAWSADMEFQVGALGGVVAAAASGEALVAQFTGPGELFIQTRAERL